MNTSHVYGDEPFKFVMDPPDLEVGLSWDAGPRLNFNPYVTFYPGEPAWKSTTVGMTLAWRLI